MRVKQNNEWINMSEEIQWRMNNEWNRHSSVSYPDYYVLNPNDWVMEGYAEIMYWGDGTDPYIVVPETDISGNVPVHMVIIPVGSPILGIASGSAKLESAEWMFQMQAPFGGQNTIELDYFFTPNITSMTGMFESAEYEYLDLRSFDTTKCYDFSSMFWGTEFLITLDISSFDIDINNDSVDNMFEWSGVETVYVKSQQIADYLDMYGGKSGINFVVGSST